MFGNSLVFGNKTFGMAASDSLIRSVFLDHLDGDEDMVTMNLGDNVNTPEKIEVFRRSFPAMLAAVRAKCPDARVVVMGCWYGTPERYEIITSACAVNGVEFLSFAGMPTLATRSHPSDAGFKLIADRFIAEILRL